MLIAGAECLHVNKVISWITSTIDEILIVAVKVGDSEYPFV
jgi:hypothetical protein